MTVRVLIERTVEPGKPQEDLLDLMKQLRAKALHQPGYVSGETLISVDRPGMHLVISTWHSLKEWRAWENNPERLEILAKIEPLLAASPKTSVFTEPWVALPEGV